MPVGPDTVLVVRIRLNETPPTNPLDENEQRQAGRFVFERDRRRYLAAHTAVRVTLGRLLGIDPREVRFAVGPHGKPHLIGPPLDLRFNLSHSGEQALLGIALGRDVGIDIEQWKMMSDMLGVAQHVFSPTELARLQQTPEERRPDVFFRIWTRKESFIKALGDGMSFPLAGFEVSDEPSGEQLLLACSAAPREMERWTMRDLACEAGHTAAITVEGRDFEVVESAYDG